MDSSEENKEGIALSERVLWGGPRVSVKLYRIVARIVSVIGPAIGSINEDSHHLSFQRHGSGERW
jgi:hypothetical protein